MDQRPPPPLHPHVLIFPFPIQGHVNSMLKLAELLCLAGLHVTFLNSDYNQCRLLRHAATATRLARYPGFRFETFPDGLPDDHVRSGARALDVIMSVIATAGPHLRRLFASGRACSSETNALPRPITCVITDGVMGFAIDVAKEVGIPILYFRTISACCFWAYICVPELVEAGEIPFIGKDMDQLVKAVPGMEGIVRRRDLPSFLRVDDPADPTLQLIARETRRSFETHALIINTSEHLEGPVLAHIRPHCPALYPIGPLNMHLRTRLARETTSLAASSPAASLSNSLLEEDASCVTWLDTQPSDSVIYVSFGSITEMTETELMEFWHGLVDSRCRFLWVVRPGSVCGAAIGGGNIPAEVAEGTRERGCIVGWAPQEEVLAHRAVGGFLTHSGWNSTLESLAAGKPMICWPYLADQQINSRFASEVWKVGLDMKDRCDRGTVERMVRDLMVVRRDELAKSTAEMARLVKECVEEGGSSYCSLGRLIEHIRLISGQATSLPNNFSDTSTV